MVDKECRRKGERQLADSEQVNNEILCKHLHAYYCIE